MNTKQERQDAIERLRSMLAPGDSVYTILRHVSRSGMSRSISLVIPDQAPSYEGSALNIRYITWLVEKRGA